LTPDEQLVSIQESFSSLTDPRVNRRRRHLLIDIVVIAMCAVICGAESWKDMRIWGEARQTWLEQFLELPNGIPSRDTFRRVISRLDPEEFQRCFVRWIKSLSRHTKGRIVAVDGKTLRRSMDSAEGRNPLHIVSAWASDQHLALGQLTVDSKSNEITAIPELLRLLELQGALVTIDAMGCQKNIAGQIVQQEADYCLAVKGNQEHLEEDISQHFQNCLGKDFADTPHTVYSTEEKGHGREEKRLYYMTPVPDTLRNAKAWANLRGVGMAITYRSTKPDDDPDGEVRYYICSFEPDAKRLAEATRGHWGIENSLHWILDVTFNEDQCRIRDNYGAENFSWLRRFATTLLKNEPTIKDTVRAKRMRATWDVSYLEAVLLAAVREN